MKEIRDISDNEREILLKGRLRSWLSLPILFYIMGILLPFFTCMVITLDFTYLYMFVAGIILLLFIVVLYPLMYYNHLQTAKIKCFESVVLSCKKSDIYYYRVEIENFDGEFLNITYPIYKRVKVGTEIVVVMVLGKKQPRKFILIEKERGKLLSCKKTRYDLI